MWMMKPRTALAQHSTTKNLAQSCLEFTVHVTKSLVNLHKFDPAWYSVLARSSALQVTCHRMLMSDISPWVFSFLQEKQMSSIWGGWTGIVMAGVSVVEKYENEGPGDGPGVYCPCDSWNMEPPAPGIFHWKSMLPDQEQILPIEKYLGNFMSSCWISLKLWRATRLSQLTQFVAFSKLLGRLTKVIEERGSCDWTLDLILRFWDRDSLGNWREIHVIRTLIICRKNEITVTAVESQVKVYCWSRGNHTKCDNGISCIICWRLCIRQWNGDSWGQIENIVS